MLKSSKFPPSVKRSSCLKSHLWFSLETSKIGMVLLLLQLYKPLGSLPIIHDFSCCRKYCNSTRDGNSDSKAKNTFGLLHHHAYHNYNSTNDFIIAE